MNWDYASIEYSISAALLVCAMFGMGATLTVKDFLGVLKAPRGLFLVLGIQIIAMPIVAIMLAKIFDLPAGITIGMVLVAALPGGLFSNLVTWFGKGNIALSVSATAVCTVACLFTTVFVLKTFATTELPPDFSMPAVRILYEVLFCLMLPLLLGMSCYRLFPTASPRISIFCVRASVLLLLLILVAALSAGRFELRAFGWKSPLILLLFALIALWFTYGTAALIRLNTDDSFTVSIEVLIRNIHLGVLLKAALFPASDAQHMELADGVLYVLILYGGISLVVAGSEVFAKYNKLGPIFGRELKPAEAQRSGVD